MTNENQRESGKDSLTIIIAICLNLGIGVLITYGSLRWIKAEIKEYFDISYSAYGMLLITVFCIAELWAIFVQIPSISGYKNTIPLWLDYLRIAFGSIVLVVYLALILMYIRSDKDSFKLWLADAIYELNEHSQNNDYVDRIAMIEEIIRIYGESSERFIERGKLYLDIAQIKSKGTEVYKYRLPDKDPQECYSIAVNCFEDARNIIEKSDDDSNKADIAECYFLSGKAKFLDSTTSYVNAKNDFESAILINPDIPDYHFYCAKTWYKLYEDNSANAISNAVNQIEAAINIYSNSKDIDLTTNENTSIADILSGNDINQDIKLAEYLYNAGTIYYSRGQSGDLQKSIDLLKLAITYDKVNSEYLNELGIKYYESGNEENLSSAIEAFDNAIRIDKANADYVDEGYHLAWKAHVTEGISGHTDEAIEIYKDAIKRRPDYEYSYQRLADIYRSRNDYEIATKIYSEAIINCENDAPLYYECGVMHYQWIICQEYGIL